MRSNQGISQENKGQIKAISENPHTTLQVFLPVFGIVETVTHIPHYAQAPRLEDEQKSCAIWYKCFRQSPKHLYFDEVALKP